MEMEIKKLYFLNLIVIFCQILSINLFELYILKENLKFFFKSKLKNQNKPMIRKIRALETTHFLLLAFILLVYNLTFG